jgi:telomere length regulation protein
MSNILRSIILTLDSAHAQVLLLSAGYLHRISPIKLTILLRSGPYLNTISNRIAAFQDRAKFLGMVVGEALSGLVHGAEKKLDFHMDEMNSKEAQWYKSLVQVSDQVGPISPLKVEDTANRKATKVSKQSKPTRKPASRPSPAAPKSRFIIEEIEDDEEEEDEDDDLVPYDKPDSDSEDSDEDPTLINRDKPKAPVYIRDLITYLRDVDNYDRQKLAVQTAPVLIRRKANYGTEVSSHSEELAGLLVGLSDKYDLDDFHSLRLQGMVAVVVALPQRMGPWFAKTFFDGDYSLSQRASILVVLGLAGRELAGYEISEYAVESAFPSKQLPAKVERLYASLPTSLNSVYESSGSRSSLKALPPNALDNISQSLSQKFLAPLAAEAADATTGPDALKLSTFTSRLEQQKQQGQEPPHLVEQKTTLSSSKSKPHGVRTIPNTTANLLSTAFFFPLTGRFQLAMHATAGGSSNILFQPQLLSLYVRTLALLLHAAGPSTLALPRMTTEFWDLLLSVLRSSAASAASRLSSPLDAAAAELPVLHAVLFGLLALLDVHEAGAGDGLRELCARHGREVVETTEWVGAVFDRVRGGDAGGDGEENQVKMMAAGVLIRLRDAVERYRGLLMGDLIGYA